MASWLRRRRQPPLALPAPLPFKRASRRWAALKDSLRGSVSALGVKPLRAIVSSRRGAKRILKRTEFAASGPEAERRFDEAPNPCTELSKAVTAADPRQETLRRRGLYEVCRSLVLASGGRPVFPEMLEGISPYVFPFYAEGSVLRGVRKALSREGLDSFPWPELPGAVAPTAPQHYKNLWCVPFLW